MLKGISNIKQNGNPDNSSKNIYKKYSIGNLIKDNNVHDSFSISKGYKILRDYSLQIKKFKKNQAGFLKIIFDYGGIHFETDLNLENINNYYSLDYSLRYDLPQPNFEISLLTRTFYSGIVESILKVDNIRFLMDRVNSLNVTSELNVSNTRALTNLLDNIYKGVLVEFKQINSVLASAAINIFNLSQKNDISENENNELIILEKITPYNEYGN